MCMYMYVYMYVCVYVIYIYIYIYTQADLLLEVLLEHGDDRDDAAGLALVRSAQVRAYDDRA